MKQVTAKLKYLKVAPRKVRLLADALKGLPVQEAEAQLLMRTQRSAPALLRLLRSAVANAKNNQLDTAKLYVSSVRVDHGPMLKRMLPRAMVRATLIQKKMSHISLILSEAAEAKSQRFNIVKPEKKRPETSEKKPKKGVPVETKKQEQKPREDKSFDQPKPKNDGFFKKIFRRKSV